MDDDIYDTMKRDHDLAAKEVVRKAKSDALKFFIAIHAAEFIAWYERDYAPTWYAFTRDEAISTVLAFAAMTGIPLNTDDLTRHMADEVDTVAAQVNTCPVTVNAAARALAQWEAMKRKGGEAKHPNDPAKN